MRKNGFTLIELLAVIIILAIIALIATPIVLDVIDKAKTSAAKSEAAMIVSGINNYCATETVYQQLDSTYTSKCTDADAISTNIALMVDLGNATFSDLSFSKKVTGLTVSSNGKTVTYDGTTYSVN